MNDDMPPAEVDALSRFSERASDLIELTRNLEGSVDHYPHDRDSRAHIEEVIDQAPTICEDLADLDHEVKETFDL